jgi:hypothetical protein
MGEHQLLQELLPPLVKEKERKEELSMMAINLDLLAP